MLADDLKEIDRDNDPEIAELRRALINTQKQLQKHKQRDQLLGETVFRAAYDAMLAMGHVKPVEAPKKDTRKSKAEVALLHATDWQGAKVTTTYNTEVMKKRVMDFAYKSVEIT